MNDLGIIIEIAKQQLDIFAGANPIRSYPISSSRFGVGEEAGSFRTPRGLHQVRAKIGQGAPVKSVFVGRRITGEIYSNVLQEQYPERDWILSRILWLSGLEKGKNRLGLCDSMRRYIYIHGTSAEDLIGQPASYGCIRMRNQDIIELFDWVKTGTKVLINA